MPNKISLHKDVMFKDADGRTIYFDESTDFFKNWNAYEVTVETDKGPITLKWNNVQSLAANWLMQTGSWMGSPNLQNFFHFFPMWCEWNWLQNSQRGLYNLPDNPTIIDIGAGNSVLDLLLHKYHNNSELFLVDRKSFITDVGVAQHPTNNNPCWLHSWNIVEDAIETSGLDKSKFHFLDIDDEWNVEADLITSFMAWCMHFPKEMYWNRVLKSLKIGGRLVVDVNIGWEKECIEEISDQLHCRHTVITSIPVKPVYNSKIPTEQPNRDQLNVSAYRCSWVRHR